MSYLTHLSLQDLRHFPQLECEFSARINIICGANGSGKSTLLEAIHLLGLGRSFRSHRLKPLVRWGEEAFWVRGQVLQGQDPPLPLAVGWSGALQIRIAGERVSSAAQLAHTLPLLLINQDGFQLFQGGPSFRRRFLDWGVFHMEQGFLGHWQRLQRVVKQRNAALRQGIWGQAPQMLAWNQELAQVSQEVHEHRERYFVEYKEKFNQVQGALLGSHDIELGYTPGWDLQQDLKSLLNESVSADGALGYTRLGAQRADLQLKVGGRPVQQALSRGQQKLLVCALYLAQGLCLHDLRQRPCLFLMDDLPAELDRRHQGLLLEQLMAMEAQVFITGVELAEMSHFSAQGRVFHVERESGKAAPPARLLVVE